MHSHSILMGPISPCGKVMMECKWELLQTFLGHCSTALLCSKFLAARTASLKTESMRHVCRCWRVPRCFVARFAVSKLPQADNNTDSSSGHSLQRVSSWLSKSLGGSCRHVMQLSCRPAGKALSFSCTTQCMELCLMQKKYIGRWPWEVQGC